MCINLYTISLLFGLQNSVRHILCNEIKYLNNMEVTAMVYQCPFAPAYSRLGLDSS